MLKKLLFGTSAAALAIAAVPLFAAFEAHVINVTARIENALAVNTEPIRFGTVFPQEKLDKKIEVALSGSFLTEDRVDDVHYIIRQKPKCAITWNNGENYDPTSTTSGEPKLDAVDRPFIDCGPAPRPLDTAKGEVWGALPLLCPYISKHPVPNVSGESNDGSLPAFHEIGTFVNKQWVWNDVDGNMSKIFGDVFDIWNLDLRVPCFKGQCAQDWDEFVRDNNPQADPFQYVLPESDEHKIFGCDIWIEVAGISPTPRPTP